MQRLIYESDLDMVVEEIEDYIAQSDPDQQEEYRRELNEARGDLSSLAATGVFLDAVGKVVDACERNRQLVVIVKTEY